MASTSHSLTPAEVAQLLNKELNVPSSDIHDVLLDYFTTDADHSDNDKCQVKNTEVQKFKMN